MCSRIAAVCAAYRGSIILIQLDSGFVCCTGRHSRTDLQQRNALDSMINLPTLQLSDEGQPTWRWAWPGHVTNSVAVVPRAAAAAALVQKTWRSVPFAVHIERKGPNKHTEWLRRKKHIERNVDFNKITQKQVQISRVNRLFSKQRTDR